MTVRLTVDRAAWTSHVQTVAASYGEGLVAVVKGNGYGFTRPMLHGVVAANGAGFVCVGTAHELADVPAELTAVVLTPTLTAPAETRAVLTGGNVEHVHALEGWAGSVMVKLASSMRRYGAAPSELAALLAAIETAGLQVIGFGLHLPLAGDDNARLAEIEQWLPALPAGSPLWVSHLSAESFHRLAATHPHREFRIRVGTALWHGVPRADWLRLTADVLQTQQVRAGETAGYHHTPVPFDGRLVAIGAGSTHGVAPIEDADPGRRSPFHYQRHRLALLERPHMHTSLAVALVDQPCPQVGDWVDVQRPLISTAVDELLWT
ncbi:MAG: alanine racemase [Ilumatobacteraceae bacterium]|nr:alanine racemase [Ilumatobacteraceae bacterium]